MRALLLICSIVSLAFVNFVHAAPIKLTSAYKSRSFHLNLSVGGKSVEILCLKQSKKTLKVPGIVGPGKRGVWRSLASLKGSKLKPYLYLRRAGLTHSQIVKHATSACNSPLVGGFNKVTPSNGGALPFNPPPNPINAQLELSRISGIAPLAVFANAAKLTTGLAGNDHLNPNYIVDWDATGVDPSGLGNQELGFMSAHVYTLPGTYSVRMAVLDPLGNFAVSMPITVTVQDPNIQFMPPYGQTFCFATTNAPDFSACPTQDSSKHIITNNIANAISTYGGAHRRLLLHRGDTWYENGIIVPQAGPQSIGAYPNSSSVTGPAPRIISNGVNYQFIISGNNTNDLRISDLELVGNYAGGALDPNLGGISMHLSQHGLLLNNKIRNVNFHGISTGDADTLIVANNSITDSGQYGMYGGANRLGIIRNTIHNLSVQMHGIRINDTDTAPDYLLIKGNRLTNLASFTAITARGNNEEILISDNYAEKIITFAPQNSTSAEYVKNVVFERNTQRPAIGSTSLGQGVGCTAENVIIRNNVWENAGVAVGLPNHPLVPSCANVFIYNNTFFNPTNVLYDEHHFLWADSNARKVWLFNNLYYSASSTNWGSAIHFAAPLHELISAKNMYYAPNQGASWLQFDSPFGGGSLSAWKALGQEILSTNSNPQFESTNQNSPSYLKLAAGSPAIDSGINIAVGVDNTKEARPHDGDNNGIFEIDIGAHERR